LEMGFHFLLRQACTVILLFYTFHVARMAGMNHCTQLLLETAYWKLFLPSNCSGLKQWPSQSQTPKQLGLQAWTTRASFSAILIPDKADFRAKNY
jgi:hypothetical protein